VPGRSAPFAPSLRSLRLLFKGGNAEDAKTIPVSSYPRRRVSRAARSYFACRPGPRIRVRGDDGVDTNSLTLRSGASRRGSPLEAPRLQPLLRDGASAPPQDENEAVWNIVRLPLRVLCAFSAFFALTLQRWKRGGREDKPCIVLPAKAGIQGSPFLFCLPPWTPDHVRGDEIPANTHPHPEERSVSKGEPSGSTGLIAPPSRRR